LLGRAERAPFVQVPLEEVIRGAGNMAGHAVDRLRLAPVSLGRARVDDLPVRFLGRCRDFARTHRPADARRAHEVARRVMLLTRRGWPCFGRPLREPAVEYGDRVVAHPAEHPPQPAGIHASVLIVGYNLNSALDAEA